MEKKEYIHPAIITREIHLSMAILSPVYKAGTKTFDRGEQFIDDENGFLKDIDVENDGSIWENSID